MRLSGPLVQAFLCSAAVGAFLFRPGKDEARSPFEGKEALGAAAHGRYTHTPESLNFYQSWAEHSLTRDLERRRGEIVAPARALRPLRLAPLAPRPVGRAWPGPRREAPARAAVFKEPLRDAPSASSADVLLGVRVAAGQTPKEASELLLGRLSLSSELKLRRYLGYQALPGESRTVVLLEGRLPVKNFGRVLADPEVVRFEPMPAQAKSQARPKPRRSSSAFFLFLLGEHPAWLLSILLVSMTLFGFLKKSR